MDIRYVAFINDAKWPHFLWNVIINSEVFQYKTGIGHATSVYTKTNQKNSRPKFDTVYDSVNLRWIHKPIESEILECLKNDAQLGLESFDSFCDNLGYSNDSISAFDSYRACADTYKRLQKALGFEEFRKLMEREFN